MLEVTEEELQRMLALAASTAVQQFSEHLIHSKVNLGKLGEPMQVRKTPILQFLLEVVGAKPQQGDLSEVMRDLVEKGLVITEGVPKPKANNGYITFRAELALMVKIKNSSWSLPDLVILGILSKIMEKSNNK